MSEPFVPLDVEPHTCDNTDFAFRWPDPDCVACMAITGADDALAAREAAAAVEIRWED